MNQEQILVIHTILKRCYSIPIVSMFMDDDCRCETWRRLERRNKLLKNTVDQIIDGCLVTILPKRVIVKILEYDSGAIETRFGVTW